MQAAAERDADIIEAIGVMAKKEGSSANAIVNGTLRKHVEWAHDWGMKHSIYYEEAAKTLFGRLGIKPEISMTDSQVTVTISARDVHR